MIDSKDGSRIADRAEVDAETGLFPFVLGKRNWYFLYLILLRLICVNQLFLSHFHFYYITNYEGEFGVLNVMCG